jgi:hypothetical protein
MWHVCILVTGFLIELLEVVNCTVYVISCSTEGKKILNNPGPCIKLMRYDDEASECKCIYHNRKNYFFKILEEVVVVYFNWLFTIYVKDLKKAK